MKERTIINYLEWFVVRRPDEEDVSYLVEGFMTPAGVLVGDVIEIDRPIGRPKSKHGNQKKKGKTQRLSK